MKNQPMRVKDLLALLEKADPEAIVLTPDDCSPDVFGKLYGAFEGVTRQHEQYQGVIDEWTRFDHPCPKEELELWERTEEEYPIKCFCIFGNFK